MVSGASLALVSKGGPERSVGGRFLSSITDGMQDQTCHLGARLRRLLAALKEQSRASRAGRVGRMTQAARERRTKSRGLMPSCPPFSPPRCGMHVPPHEYSGVLFRSGPVHCFFRPRSALWTASSDSTAWRLPARRCQPGHTALTRTEYTAH